MKRSPAFAVFGCIVSIFIACSVTPLFGAEVKSESEKLDEILAELKELRVLLEERSGVAGQQVLSGEMELTDEPMLGQPQAPLTIVMVTDYQCPFCQEFHARTFSDLKKLYIDTGKVRFYVKDMPLDSHPDAATAAQAAHCAQDQGQFWSFHDHMQSNPDQLGLEKLVSYARQIGLDVDPFSECLTDGRYAQAVETSARDALALGAQGTPAFLVGRSTAYGVEGEWLVGAMPLGDFERIFRSRRDVEGGADSSAPKP